MAAAGLAAAVAASAYNRTQTGPQFECTRGRELASGPGVGGIESGRRWRGWWADVGGTTVPVAWPAAATKEERQNAAVSRGKKRTVVPNPKLKTLDPTLTQISPLAQ